MRKFGFTLLLLSAFALTTRATDFENTGGMWMPSQMGNHVETLKDLGIEFDAENLTKPLEFPLGAVVSLGFCSASFVSPDGLIVTNHHCVEGFLEHMTLQAQAAGRDVDYIEEGYLAADKSKELRVGSSGNVYVTQAFTDVTEEVLKDINAIAGHEERYAEIQRRRAALVQKCEEGRPEISCEVAEYFNGLQFFQIEKLHIRDVRMVYAPHKGVGFFGGFDDNWRWPRQVGDYAFIRAYVGPDGKPAAPSADNIPFNPKLHLKVATKALEKDDLVMVAGYPGRTYRLKSAGEVKDDVDFGLKRIFTLYKGYRETLEKLGESDPTFKTATHTLRFSLLNAQQYYEGSLHGLVERHIVRDKMVQDEAVNKWANLPANKEKYGNVMASIDAVRDAYNKNKEKDLAIAELLGRGRGEKAPSFTTNNLIWAAYVVARRAYEAEKPEAERHADYKEATWTQWAAKIAAIGRSYNEKFDRGMTQLILSRMNDMAAEKRPSVYNIIVKEGTVESAVKNLFEGEESKFLRTGERSRLITAGWAELNASTDPFIRAGVALVPQYIEAEKRFEAYQGQLAALKPLYADALIKSTGKLYAPDANSTLRVTFGTVKGYKRPGPTSLEWEPFTLLSSMLAKGTAAEPFIIPEPLKSIAKKAIEEKEYGPYGSETYGELTVNFLSDLDITGGNSGSATINSRGELVGLAFDGNYEGMASDYVYMADVTRAIHVDIRYTLWIMDAVDNADHVLKEMGVTPSIGESDAFDSVIRTRRRSDKPGVVIPREIRGVPPVDFELPPVDFK